MITKSNKTRYGQRIGFISKVSAIACIILLVLMKFPLPTAAATVENPETEQMGLQFIQSEPAGIEPDCIPLDIVFLVDQSGSMMISDPLIQRDFIVVAAIDIIADRAFRICPHTSYRVALVSFGDAPVIDLTLSIINPDTSEEVLQIRSVLKQDLPVSREAEGESNLLAAIQIATQMLDESPPLDDEPRKKALILITDGDICLDNCASEEIPNRDVASDLSELQRRLEEIMIFSDAMRNQQICYRALIEKYDMENVEFDNLRRACNLIFTTDAIDYRNSVFVWVILLRNEKPVEQAVFERYEAITTYYGGGVLTLSQERREVPNTLQRILSFLDPYPFTQRFGCRSFAVNPYLRRMRLTFYKFDSAVSVTISYHDEAGQEHVLKDGQGDDGFNIVEYSQEGANERYVLGRPYPGIWQLQAENCDGLDPFYDPDYDVAFEMLNYNFPERSYLRGILTTSNGSLIDPYPPPFDIHITSEIHKPDGREQEIDFIWNETERMFVSEEPFQLTYGTDPYFLNVLGITKVHNGEPANIPLDSPLEEIFDSEQVLFDETFEFAVLPTFAVEVLSPQPAEVYPIHRREEPEAVSVEPILIDVVPVDEENQPIEWSVANFSAFFSNTMKATVRSGSLMATVLLTPDPHAPGHLVGAINDFNSQGEHELHLEWIAGVYPLPIEPIIFLRSDETWQFEIVSPEAQVYSIHQKSFSWPLPLVSIPIIVKLKDAQGFFYDNPTKVARYAPAALTAEVISEETGHRETVTLSPLDGSPGIYRGEIAQLSDTGRYLLNIDAAANLGFKPNSTPVTTAFYRQDTLWTSPTTYSFLFLFLCILIILSIYYRYFIVGPRRFKARIALNILETIKTVDRIAQLQELFPSMLPDWGNAAYQTNKIVPAFLQIAEYLKGYPDIGNFFARFYFLETAIDATSKAQDIINTLHTKNREFWKPTSDKWQKILDNEVDKQQQILHESLTIQDLIDAASDWEWLPASAKETYPQVSVLPQEMVAIARDLRSYLNGNSYLSKRFRLDEVLGHLESLQEQLQSSFFSSWVSLVEFFKVMIVAELGSLQMPDSTVVSISNPYQYGNPLNINDLVARNTLFKGREDLANELQARLTTSPNSTYVLSGPRRMGKTSFLLQLPALLEGNTIPVFIDLQRPSRIARDEAFLYTFASSIVKGAKRYGIEMEGPTQEELGKEPFETFGKWLDTLAERIPPRFRVLITFDEFEKAGTALREGKMTNAVLGELRDISQHQQQMTLLFAGVLSMDDLGPDWSHFFINAHQIRIGHLKMEEAVDLIRHPVPGFEEMFVFEDKAVQHILYLTNKHPYLIQLLCACIIELARANRLSSANQELVESAVSLTFERGNPYFHNLWNEMVGESAQSILVKIAGASFPIEVAIRDRDEDIALKRLLQHGIIKKQNNSYEMMIPLVQHWVNQNHRLIPGS